MLKEIYPKDKLTDHDIETLEELSKCLLGIWSKEIEEKGRDNIYDNNSLDSLIAVFTSMVDDLVQKKNMKDYVSYVRGAYLTIYAPRYIWGMAEKKILGKNIKLDKK